MSRWLSLGQIFLMKTSSLSAMWPLGNTAHSYVNVICGTWVLPDTAQGEANAVPATRPCPSCHKALLFLLYLTHMT